MKKHLTLRLDESQLQKIKDKASIQHQTVTDYVTHVLQTDKEDFWKAKIQNLEQQIHDWKEKYENSTKTKIPKTHRISVGFTHEEYVSIKKLADQKRVSKSQLLHDKILGTHVTQLPKLN